MSSNMKARWYGKLHGIRCIEALDVVIVDLENGEIAGVMGRF